MTEMTEFKTTALIFLASLLKKYPEHIDSVKYFVAELEKKSNINTDLRSENSEQDHFIGLCDHLFTHHPELKHRAYNLFDQESSQHNNKLFLQIRHSLAAWSDMNFSLPIPFPIKRLVLSKNKIDNATWVETGTAMGDTTIFLSELAPIVYSIEPFEELHNHASSRFKNFNNIKLIKGTSEEILPSLLNTIDGDVCFFLDGHYSGEGTFLNKTECPLIDELFLIGKNKHRYNRIMVAIDDLNFCTGVPHESYPSLNYLISWAQFNRLTWHIEHNIFIARN